MVIMSTVEQIDPNNSYIDCSCYSFSYMDRDWLTIYRYFLGLKLASTILQVRRFLVG